MEQQQMAITTHTSKAFRMKNGIVLMMREFQR
jgi:hypothetical protein